MDDENKNKKNKELDLEGHKFPKGIGASRFTGFDAMNTRLLDNMAKALSGIDTSRLAGISASNIRLADNMARL